MFEFDKPQDMVFPDGAYPLLSQIRAILDLFSDNRMRAVIGGGVLRDLYLGREYKDIDLFLNAADGSDEKVIELLTKQGFTCKMIVSMEATEYLTFTDVASVIEATHPVLLAPLQIVRMAANNLSGERMIERLDLGPCQIGMDHLGNFWTTDIFRNDVVKTTFTVTRDGERDIDRSTKRFTRLSLKYPGWKLVLPG